MLRPKYVSVPLCAGSPNRSQDSRKPPVKFRRTDIFQKDYRQISRAKTATPPCSAALPAPKRLACHPPRRQERISIVPRATDKAAPDESQPRRRASSVRAPFGFRRKFF